MSTSAYAWGERGKRFQVASSSPGLKAKISFHGLYLYNDGQVRIWDPTTGIATTSFQPKDVAGLVLYGDVLQPIYLYVHAVDAAGNTGDATTYVYFSWSGTPG